MKTWKLIALVVTLIILLGIATVTQRSSSSNIGNRIAEKTLLEGVDLKAITAVNVFKGENIVKMYKRDDQWFVGSLYNYPVHQEKLFTALRELSEVKTGMPQRSGNILPFEYGLEEGVVLYIELIAGDELARAFEVGRPRKSTNPNYPKDTRYLRVVDSDIVQLVEYDFAAFSEIGPAWTQREILSIQPTNIVSISTHEFDIAREDGKWVLANATEEEAEKFQQDQADRVSNLLEGFNFAHVIHPRAPIEELGYDKEDARFYTAKTRDGKTISIRLGVETHKGTVIKIGGDVSYRAADWVYAISDNELSRFVFSRDELFVKIPERSKNDTGMGMGGLFQQFNK